jgi:uncharacterized membrane protein
MSTLYTTLLFLHGLNRWLAFLSGIWALALVLPGLLDKRAFGHTERISVSIFAGTLYLQIALGLLLFAVMSIQHIPLFSGRAAAEWGHMIGGFLAVIFGSLAILSSRKAAAERRKYSFTALWSGLALLLTGHLPLMAGLLGLLLLAHFIIAKLYKTPASELEQP